MARVIIDPDSTSLRECFALIKSPRKDRERYPGSCVTPVDSEETAREQADSGRNLHPAIVYGPSVSSESQYIYYLVRWLA